MLNKEKNITIIYITHHIDEVENADYLYVMNQGELVLQGTPDEIWKESETSEKLEQYGIPLPFDKKLIQLLRNGGMKIPDDIRSEQMLLDYLTDKLEID